MEASLVFPILILVLMATLELGMLFKDYLAISALSRDGARIGALAGDDPEADCAIVLGIEALATGGLIERIDPVEIYRANVNGSVAVGGGPNFAQWVGGGPPRCTVPADPVNDTWVLAPPTWIPQPCLPPWLLPQVSCRQTSVGTTTVSGVTYSVTPDIIGVRVQMTHNWITGFPPFRGSVQIDERTITRLEPKAFISGG